MSEDQENLIDLLRKMLNYNSLQRITAKKAMEHPYFGSLRHQKPGPVKKVK
jgi:serine/threonine protein kinase